MIKRYYATKDNTITNAFEENLQTRATGSNMGAADIVEVFSIYAQASTSSAELTRFLIEFDTTELATDRSAGLVPVSGSVSWYLRMFNAPHSQTVPSNFDLTISAVSQSWEEGYGMDMDYYEDTTRNGIGSNWINRASASAWVAQGGDYHVSPTFNQTFKTGLEDLEVDVSELVEQWLKSDKANDGFGVKLSDALETTNRSFFRKKFFGKDSEFFFQRPILEARWDSSRRDDRGSFYASSSLAPALDNVNTLYLYNSIRGRLRDIPDLGSNDIYVDLYDSLGGTKITGSFTGSAVATGIYDCNVVVQTTASTIYDIWFSGSTEYHSGTISVNNFTNYVYNSDNDYILSMPSLKNQYRKNQTHRLNLYVREKNWSPNIYTVAVRTSIPSVLIESASYQVRRSIDNYVVVPYGTGSTMHTGLSYDVSGNYFDLDTTYLETGYLYEVQYSFYDEDNGWQEQSNRFKFRVVD